MMRSRYLGDKQIPLLRLLGTMPWDPPTSKSHVSPHPASRCLMGKDTWPVEGPPGGPLAHVCLPSRLRALSSRTQTLWGSPVRKFWVEMFS